MLKFLHKMEKKRRMEVLKAAKDIVASAQQLSTANSVAKHQVNDALFDNSTNFEIMKEFGEWGKAKMEEKESNENLYRKIQKDESVTNQNSNDSRIELSRDIYKYSKNLEGALQNIQAITKIPTVERKKQKDQNNLIQSFSLEKELCKVEEETEEVKAIKTRCEQFEKIIKELDESIKTMKNQHSDFQKNITNQDIDINNIKQKINELVNQMQEKEKNNAEMYKEKEEKANNLKAQYSYLQNPIVIEDQEPELKGPTRLFSPRNISSRRSQRSSRQSSRHSSRHSTRYEVTKEAVPTPPESPIVQYRIRVKEKTIVPLFNVVVFDEEPTGTFFNLSEAARLRIVPDYEEEEEVDDIEVFSNLLNNAQQQEEEESYSEYEYEYEDELEEENENELTNEEEEDDELEKEVTNDEDNEEKEGITEEAMNEDENADVNKKRKKEKEKKMKKQKKKKEKTTQKTKKVKSEDKLDEENVDNQSEEEKTDNEEISENEENVEEKEKTEKIEKKKKRKMRERKEKSENLEKSETSEEMENAENVENTEVNDKKEKREKKRRRKIKVKTHDKEDGKTKKKHSKTKEKEQETTAKENNNIEEEEEIDDQQSIIKEKKAYKRQTVNNQKNESDEAQNTTNDKANDDEELPHYPKKKLPTYETPDYKHITNHSLIQAETGKEKRIEVPQKHEEKKIDKVQSEILTDDEVIPEQHNIQKIKYEPKPEEHVFVKKPEVPKPNTPRLVLAHGRDVIIYKANNLKARPCRLVNLIFELENSLKEFREKLKEKRDQHIKAKPTLKITNFCFPSMPQISEPMSARVVNRNENFTKIYGIKKPPKIYYPCRNIYFYNRYRKCWNAPKPIPKLVFSPHIVTPRFV